MRTVRTEIFQDLEANRASDVPGSEERAGVVRTVGTVRYAAVVLFRLAAFVGAALPALGAAIKQVNHLVTGADIAWSASIGHGLVLWHPTGVVIGPDVTIGARCSIQQGVTLGAARSRRHPHGSPTLGDDVYVGAGARVLGRVRVGHGARIGANAVVLTDVPDSGLAVGIPARMIERRVLRPGQVAEGE